MNPNDPNEKSPEPDPFQDDWNTLKPGLPLPRMTEDELREFVRDVIGGRIFVSDQIRTALEVGMVFMPLLMGALAPYNTQSLEEIGVFWEYEEKALPRGFNGYPMFTSCRMMHRLDWIRAKKALIVEQERAKTLEIPPDEPSGG